MVYHLRSKHLMKMLGGVLVTSTAAELNYLDITTRNQKLIKWYNNGYSNRMCHMKQMAQQPPRLVYHLEDAGGVCITIMDTKTI